MKRITELYLEQFYRMRESKPGSEAYRKHKIGAEWLWRDMKESDRQEALRHMKGESSRDEHHLRVRKGRKWHGSFGVFYSPMRQRWFLLFSPKHDVDTASVVGTYATRAEAERVAKGK